ncbi:MAG: acyl carrier protein [Bacteroidetes bacterium]|nr:acyl carrier protein [Bacteroidota bacterium]
MEQKEILLQLNQIFSDILDNTSIVITEISRAKDIEEWDSLNNIQLVVAIEKHFKIKFTTLEIQNWKNVGEMCHSIQKRLQK